MNRYALFMFGLFLNAQTYAVVQDSSLKVHSQLNLEALVVDVNGVTRRHDAHEDLVIVSGDSLVIKDAILNDPKIRPTSVNVVGYVQPQAPSATDDRAVAINTAKELKPEWSVDKKGTIYNIEIKFRRETVGKVRIRLIPPELKFFAIKVNGSRQIYRPGETAVFKSNDRFKVEEIATNVENDQDSVEYELVEVSSAPVSKENKKQYKLRFFRQGIEFASVPILIENL